MDGFVVLTAVRGTGAGGVQEDVGNGAPREMVATEPRTRSSEQNSAYVQHADDRPGTPPGRLRADRRDPKILG